MARDDLLFSEGDLDATLRAHLATLPAKVDSIPWDQLMNATPEDAAEFVAAQLAVGPLALDEDSATMEQRETRIDVSEWRERNPFHDPGPVYAPAVEVIVSLPYSGDSKLWRLRPNQFRMVFPRGKVVPGRSENVGVLRIELAQLASDRVEEFKSRLDEELSPIRFYVEAQGRQIAHFDAGLLSQALEAVRARRACIEKHDGLQALLGIPLESREGAPDVASIHIERKLVRPLPPPPKAGYKAEPGVTDADYDHILAVIRHEGRTYESTPATYAVHDEEDLRNIMLAHLNGHYEGGATGETFRRSGKTDIHIEVDDRAAFVAECKIWKGAKALREAIDQLLSYLTWRDCKAAIVVFNRHNARFSGVLECIPEVFVGHPRFRKTLVTGGDGEWRFSMTSLEDEGRLVRVHVFAFNLYSERR